ARGAQPGRILRRVEAALRDGGVGHSRALGRTVVLRALGVHGELAAPTSPPIARTKPSWVHRIDAVVGAVIETAAAVLVAVEIVVLFGGVVSRYVFHAPLTWSDELASMLFLWLAMLGAAAALRRGEHMRMTAVVARLSPGGRAVAEAIGSAAALLFL